MADTKVIACDCDHEYQDKLYGNRQRVHNMTTDGKDQAMKVWRCTVCDKQHTKGRD